MLSSSKAPRRTCLALVLCASLPSAACDGAKSDDKAAAKAKPSAEGTPKTEGTATPEKPAAPTAGDAWTWNLPKGIFDPPAVPADNPMSAAKVDLGHKLFMDKRLSFDGSRSCYSCHQNELGNADGRAKALGAGDKPLSRNSPTIWNVGFHPAYYWDGRAPSLEKQALGAWKGGNMGVGADNLDAKAAEIGALAEYKSAFAEVFGVADGQAVTPMQVAQSLSAYERTLLCGDGVRDEAATRGWDLFRGKASCSTCHNGPALTDGIFHNVGIGYADGKYADPGRAKVSKEAGDEGKFRTPTLRNVTTTAPYFHDGSVTDLETAVRLMASGGAADAPNKDPNLRDVGLSDAEIADLMAYFASLECKGSLEVIGDQSVAAFATP